MNDRIYKNVRPTLVIESVYGRQLGNCYASHTYKVVTLCKLHHTDFTHLREAGFLGYGQHFKAHQILKDGSLTTKFSEQPSGFDIVQCSEVDLYGNVVRCPSINPYTGQPDVPIQVPYYVYTVVDFVDSSD